MPVYQYKCTDKKCSHVFEDLVRMKDPPPECPKCKAQAEKQISASNLKFKGDGFYSTDYK